MAHARATRSPPWLLDHLLSGDDTLMIAALSLQQCGKLLGNPLIDANSLLELPDADPLGRIMTIIDMAGTQDQRRRHAAVFRGFGPQPHDAGLAADDLLHGAHQGRICWKLRRRRFRPHLDFEPVSVRGTADFLDDRTRVDRLRVAEFDAAGGKPDGYVGKSAVICDDEVEA